MVRHYEITEVVNYRQVRELLKKYFQYIGTSVIDKEGKVILGSDCTISTSMSKLPIAFKRTGNFYCQGIGLTTLVGAPEYVDGVFNCSSNKLTSLDHCPLKCKSLYAHDNLLTSLEGAPQSVGRLYCHGNKLTSLKGCPKKLSLLDCTNNPLVSLEGFPDHIDNVSISYSPNLPILRALIAKGGIQCLAGNEVEVTISDILQKYNGKNYSRASIIACQKELIDAGYVGNAAW